MKKATIDQFQEQTGREDHDRVTFADLRALIELENRKAPATETPAGDGAAAKKTTRKR